MALALAAEDQVLASATLPQDSSSGTNFGTPALRGWVVRHQVAGVSVNVVGHDRLAHDLLQLQDLLAAEDRFQFRLLRRRSSASSFWKSSAPLAVADDGTQH